MKITLLVVGKTTSGYLGQGIDEYVRRLSHYVNFEMVCVSDARNTRNLSQSQQKQAEGRAILAAVERSDYVVLLDEHGREFTSMQLADYVQRRLSSGVKRALNGLFLSLAAPMAFRRRSMTVPTTNSP